VDFFPEQLVAHAQIGDQGFQPLGPFVLHIGFPRSQVGFADGAHVSFRAFMTCIGLARNPQNLPSPDEYCEHLARYCKYLDYMHGMFKSGKEKKDVLAGLINLHRQIEIR
jgi:hypothetical protein